MNARRQISANLVVICNGLEMNISPVSNACFLIALSLDSAASRRKMGTAVLRRVHSVPSLLTFCPSESILPPFPGSPRSTPSAPINGLPPVRANNAAPPVRPDIAGLSFFRILPVASKAAPVALSGVLRSFRPRAPRTRAAAGSVAFDSFSRRFVVRRIVSSRLLMCLPSSGEEVFHGDAFAAFCDAIRRLRFACNPTSSLVRVALFFKTALSPALGSVAYPKVARVSGERIMPTAVPPPFAFSALVSFCPGRCQ